MADIDGLKEKIKEFMSEAEDKIEGMDEWKDWDSLKEILGNLSNIVLVAKDACLIAEVIVETVEESFTNDEVKEAVKGFLDDMIKLKGLAEWASDIIIDAFVESAFVWAQAQLALTEPTSKVSFIRNLVKK